MSFSHPFNIDEHVFRSPELQDLLLKAVRFFNGTPVHQMPLTSRFPGAGVYAIYYTGNYPLYKGLSDVNKIAYRQPIYVGKAIPSGGRKGISAALSSEAKVHYRLREHTASILEANAFSKSNGEEFHLEIADFACRFILLPGDESAIIAPIESALIRIYQPLWNSTVDGFGNHTPGIRRFDQAKSSWDVIHRGREWAEKCRGTPPSAKAIFADIAAHIKKLDSLASDEIS